MRVLFANQMLAFQPGFWGGAEVQMLKTRDYLQKLGADIEIFSPATDRIEDFDILHIFCPWTFPSEASKLVNYAKEKGVKTVVSPIFWDFSELRLKLDPWRKKLYNLGNHAFQKTVYKYSFDFGLKTPERYLARVFKSPDALLPNSNLEANLIIKLFSVDKCKIYVVPNGVDPSFAKTSSTNLFTKEYALDDFILYVGRIDDPRKNVRALIQAYEKSGLDAHLVLIGSMLGKDDGWLTKQTLNSKVHYVGSFPSESDMLKSAYAASKVFALPSWLETPGLSALEAAIMGANIVITDRGSTREYFGANAWYVNPGDKESIKRALIEAYHSNQSLVLKEQILSKYTWDRVATETLNVYNKVLSTQ